MKLALYSLLGIMALVIVLGFMSTAVSVISAPGRVLRETLGTQNIINNYEMFQDLNAGFQRRVADIQSQRALLADSTGTEANRVRIELTGLQQTCRDLVARYNSASEKLNRSVFKSQNLPETLDLDACN